MNKITILVLNLVFCFNLFAISEKSFDMDESKKNKEENINLKSGKNDGKRLYKATIEKNISGSKEFVLKAILNFESRCNNELSDKRIHFDKDYKCPYFNGNIVESKIIRNDVILNSKEENETDRFVVIRNIYNRNKFEHADLIQVIEDKEKGVTFVKITMLEDKVASKFLNKKFKKNSAFINTNGEFILKSLNENETQVSYTYESLTDHWLLNKSISVGSVFESIEASFTTLFSNLTLDSKRFLLAQKKE